MMSTEELSKWIDKVGWVPVGQAMIAVKIVGVNYGYGRWMFRVAPLAGTGSWQVGVDRVEIDKHGSIV